MFVCLCGCACINYVRVCLCVGGVVVVGFLLLLLVGFFLLLLFGVLGFFCFVLFCFVFCFFLGGGGGFFPELLGYVNSRTSFCFVSFFLPLAETRFSSVCVHPFV